MQPAVGVGEVSATALHSLGNRGDSRLLADDTLMKLSLQLK